MDELKQLGSTKKNPNLHVNIPVFTNSLGMIPHFAQLQLAAMSAPGFRKSMKRKGKRSVQEGMRLESKQEIKSSPQSTTRKTTTQNSEEKKTQTIFDALIDAQSVHGYFEKKKQINPKLWKQIEPHPRFEQKTETKTKTSEAISHIEATIRILLFFHCDQQIKAKYDERKKIAQKSEKWLNDNGGPTNPQTFSLTSLRLILMSFKSKKNRNKTETKFKTSKPFAPISLT